MKKTYFARIICLLLLMMLTISLCSCSLDGKDENRVTINVKGYGRIVIELAPDVAPITVENFKKLVKQGFYDGLTFHRVADLTYNGEYIIQGGDPDGDGTGGSPDKIKGEFKNNGVENNLLHTRGVISMARSTDNDSASSQFFICTATITHLDGSYAAFGQVVDGMNVVDEIALTEVDYNSQPVDPVVMKWVRMGTRPSPTPYIFLAAGITIVLIFAWVILQSMVKGKMEDTLTLALGNNKRKRKALEESASDFSSAFYFHAKGILPKAMIWLYTLCHAAALLFAASIWVLCLWFNWVSILISAVTLLATVGIMLVLSRYPYPAK